MQAQKREASRVVSVYRAVLESVVMMVVAGVTLIILLPAKVKRREVVAREEREHILGNQIDRVA